MLSNGVSLRITITEIIDDLRAAEEVTRRFERRYWLSSADFYDLYQKGVLDDGENLEDYTTWAGFYQIKIDREVALAQLSQERAAKLRSSMHDGIVTILPPEPSLALA